LRIDDLQTLADSKKLENLKIDSLLRRKALVVQKNKNISIIYKNAPAQIDKQSM
jgi:hypothetical protein